MKVHIKVSEVEDSIELEAFLKEVRKLRQCIYMCPNLNFTIYINSELKA